jgi:hypothetical protein
MGDRSSPGPVEGPGRDHPHSRCAEILRADMAPADVTVSTAAPIVLGDYTWTEGFTCPHGVTYWVEPTGEQLLRWQAGEGAL